MGSTFLGLTIGYSGLSAYQAALHTTGNNLANVQTEGYSRQQVTRVPSESIRAYAKYGTVGTGVTAVSIDQIRDSYYDYKYWDNNERYGEFYTKNYYMTQVEKYFEEENQQGITKALSNFDSALEDLMKTPEDDSARNGLVHAASTIADTINELVASWEKVQDDCNEEIKARVDEINSIAQQMVVLNKQIAMVEVRGEKANDLRDARNLLIDQLSGICDVQVEEKEIPSNMKDAYGNFIYTGQTTYSVKIDGQLLVRDYQYNSLEVVPREVKNNLSDIDGLYDVRWKNGQDFNMKSTSVGGYLQGLIAMRDGNNAENLQGTIAAIEDGQNANGDATSIVRMSNCNITDITKATMPANGKIVLNSREYIYENFEYKGNGEYEITLAAQLSDIEKNLISIGKKAEIGNTVNYCGIPYYMSKLNEFVRCYAREANSIHMYGQDFKTTFAMLQNAEDTEDRTSAITTHGEDLNGDKTGYLYTSKIPTGGEYADGTTHQFNIQLNEDGEEVFSSKEGNYSYYNMTAKYFRVPDELLDKPQLLATTTSITQGVAGKEILDLFKKMKDNRIINEATPSQYFEALLSDISVATQSSKNNMDNYQNIGTTITNQRMSISGVDEDEEGIDLIKFQHAYNLSSKVISVMAEVYDRLILNTGV